MQSYDFSTVEKDANHIWSKFGCFTDNIDGEKFYVLGMFPYPSGQLHMGHLRNYTITDVVARFKRACGFNVLNPIGWDAFGLPAENAARTMGLNPSKWTYSNINAMSEELRKIGISYNWERELATCDPEYYKHEQEFFVQLFKDGIAYKKLSTVHWDPVDQTVLANEQVIDGRGWRSGALVEQRELSQWFLKISEYSEDLLSELEQLHDWPAAVKNMQREWIGKSSGCEIKFAIVGRDENITIFTTKPETIFGAAFCAVAVDHAIVSFLATKNEKIKDFVEIVGRRNRDEERWLDTGLTLINPLNNDRIPLYIASFVLSGYATGALFGCPAHDERDNRLALDRGLVIKDVVSAEHKFNYALQDLMIDSGFLTGKNVAEARKAVIDFVVQNDIGREITCYRLKDWGVSRQRYWGCPIPIIYCDHCGTLPANKLPVTLPDDIDFSTNLNGNPLDNHPTWKYVSCHKCGGAAVRETDTFDTFMESSWYFIGFCSPSISMTNGGGGWMPVDCYVGGIEHAILHLLYARYFTRLLHRYGYIALTEPFKKLVTQGMVCHKTYKTHDGVWLTPEEAIGRDDVIVGPSVKMSKSKKNTVALSKVMQKYGADAVRLFIMSDSPIEKQLEWSDQGLEGSLRFLRKLWDYVLREIKIDDTANHYEILKKTHILIHSATSCLADMQYNVCIAKIREYCNFLFAITHVNSESQLNDIVFAVKTLLRIMEPFVPHITQILWNRIGGKGVLHAVAWPIYQNELIIDDVVTIAVQICGVKRSVVSVQRDASEDEVYKKVSLDDKIIKNIAGRKIKKIIFIKNRAINLVI